MTFNRLFQTTLLALFLAAGSLQAEIAIVDLKKVFEGYWKTKQADMNIKDQALDFQKEAKQFDDDFKATKEEYDALVKASNDQALSTDAREQKKQEAEAKLIKLRELEQAFGQFNRQAQTRLGEERGRVRERILTEIQEVVQKKAKAAGYTLVLDSASETINQTPVVVYNNGVNDMTSELLEHLNLSAPPGFFEKAEKQLGQ
jgi:outer membrane protein